MDLADTLIYGRKVIRGSLRHYSSGPLDPKKTPTTGSELHHPAVIGHTMEQKILLNSMMRARHTFTPPDWWNIALAECRKIQPRAVKLCLKVYHSQTHGVTVPDAIKFLEERSDFEAVDDSDYRVSYEYWIREKKHKDGTYLTYIFEVITRGYKGFDRRTQEKLDKYIYSRVVIQTNIGTSKN